MIRINLRHGQTLCSVYTKIRFAIGVFLFVCLVLFRFLRSETSLFKLSNQFKVKFVTGSVHIYQKVLTSQVLQLKKHTQQRSLGPDYMANFSPVCWAEILL